jgi:ArsR family transcriptional regulator
MYAVVHVDGVTPDLDVLADDTRRVLLTLLTVEGELCVCELEAATDELQPIVSRQLAILREAGWVTGRRNGRRMYYDIAAIPGWARLILRGFSEGGVPRAALRRMRARLSRSKKAVRLA